MLQINFGRFEAIIDELENGEKREDSFRSRYMSDITGRFPSASQAFQAGFLLTSVAGTGDVNIHLEIKRAAKNMSEARGAFHEHYINRDVVPQLAGLCGMLHCAESSVDAGNIDFEKIQIILQEEKHRYYVNASAHVLKTVRNDVVRLLGQIEQATQDIMAERKRPKLSGAKLRQGTLLDTAEHP